MTFFGQKCVVLLGSQVEISTSVYVLEAINHTTLTRVGKGWGGQLIHSVGWWVGRWQFVAAPVRQQPSRCSPSNQLLSNAATNHPHLLLGRPAQKWMLKKRPISDKSQLAPKKHKLRHNWKQSSWIGSLMLMQFSQLERGHSPLTVTGAWCDS